MATFGKPGAVQELRIVVEAELLYHLNGLISIAPNGGGFRIIAHRTEIAVGMWEPFQKCAISLFAIKTRKGWPDGLAGCGGGRQSAQRGIPEERNRRGIEIGCSTDNTAVMIEGGYATQGSAKFQSEIPRRVAAVGIPDLLRREIEVPSGRSAEDGSVFGDIIHSGTVLIIQVGSVVIGADESTQLAA